MHTISLILIRDEGYNIIMAQEIISDEGFTSKPTEKFAMVHCTCCHKRVPGKIIFWPRINTEEKPLRKPCKECGVWLSHLEEDDESIKGRCFECHKENLL